MCAAALYELVPLPEGRGVPGAGTVHHVAFASTYEDHEAWGERVRDIGLNPTPVIDRFYFRSIYFREPGGVLFEIATLGPGFTSDEPLESLGEHLSLPPAFEHLRERIEPTLTPLPDIRAWRPAHERRRGFRPSLRARHGLGHAAAAARHRRRREPAGRPRPPARPEAALLSPRGQVLEDGVAPRFFARRGIGELDLDDLRAAATSSPPGWTRPASTTGATRPRVRARLLQRRQHRRRAALPPRGTAERRGAAARDAALPARPPR